MCYIVSNQMSHSPTAFIIPPQENMNISSWPLMDNELFPNGGSVACPCSGIVHTQVCRCLQHSRVTCREPCCSNDNFCFRRECGNGQAHMHLYDAFF